MRDKLGRFVKGNEEGFQKGHPVYGGKKTRFKKGQTPWNKNKKNWMPEESKKSMIKKKKGVSIWPDGRIFSKEWRENIGKAHKGKKLSEEQIRKMRGRVPWNKDIPMLKYVKEKVSRAKIKYFKEHPEAIERLKEIRSKVVTPVKDTSIEVKIQNFLKKLGIEFFTHQYMKEIEHAYQCDIFIPLMNLVIECDGDYWHKYPTGRDIDHIRTKELIKKGFKVLRLWEFEIKEMSIKEFENKIRSLR